MLSVGKIMAGPAAAAYYLDQVAQGREDYYAGEGESAGRWVGAGTRLLEWGGEVDGDDFVSLLGGAGVRKPRANGVAGFDLTFRAPKSVSVLWAIAPSDVVRELRAGHYAAVAEALGYLEREACRGRRGTDGVVQVRGDGFVGAAFVHRSSRAGDPLLHTHVVVGNLTILSFAVVEEEIEFNPAAPVKKPRYEREREPVIFLPTDVELLRAKLAHSPRDRALVSVLAYSGPRPEEALRLRWRDIGEEAIHYDGRKTRKPRWTPLLPHLAVDLREWSLASGRPGPNAPVFPAHDGGHWDDDDWRNWRRRSWQRVAPAGTRPRDLRSSYVTVQVYAGVPLTEIGRHCGTSLVMLDKHYAGVIANYDGRRILADEQIASARSKLAATSLGS